MSEYEYLRGCDLSHWNTDRDFNLVLPYSDFFILKASEGKGYKDPTYKARFKKCLESDKCVGSYHFYKNCSVNEQYKNIVNTMEDRPKYSPYVLDVEIDCNWNEVFVLANMLANHYGRKPIIYTMASMLKYVKNCTYPVWVARYNNNCTKEDMIQGNVVMWQYTDKGTFNGNGVCVDCDWYKGTYKDFMNLGKKVL